MPEQIFYERIVRDAMELACRMMKCGAEVRNVEKTVERLCDHVIHVRYDTLPQPYGKLLKADFGSGHGA